MREAIINKHKFAFYDGIDTMPIKQFHLYSKYVLVEGGIGDSISDIDTHIGKIMELIKANQGEKALKACLNLRQGMYMVLNGLDIHNKATLCLTKSVDGKDWTDWSESGLQSLYELIEEGKVKDIEEIRKEIGEKLDKELQTYFPEIFESAKEKNYLDALKAKALLQLAQIVDGVDNSKEIERVDKELASFLEPKCFEGKDSEEVKFDKQFEDMCLAMSKEFGGAVKGYTIMEFYSAFAHMDKEQKEIKKKLKKK